MHARIHINRQTKNQTKQIKNPVKKKLASSSSSSPSHSHSPMDAIRSTKDDALLLEDGRVKGVVGAGALELDDL